MISFTRLKPENKKKAETLGLVLTEQSGYCAFIKPSGSAGNKLPSPVPFALIDPVEMTETLHYSDCPIISIMENSEGKPFRVQCWDWVPGPGPGDFEKFFDTEEEAVECVIDYLFEENEYFNKRKEDEEKKIR